MNTNLTWLLDEKQDEAGVSDLRAAIETIGDRRHKFRRSRATIGAPGCCGPGGRGRRKTLGGGIPNGGRSGQGDCNGVQIYATEPTPLGERSSDKGNTDC